MGEVSQALLEETLPNEIVGYPILPNSGNEK
jgi:hypothetical protein